LDLHAVSPHARRLAVIALVLAALTPQAARAQSENSAAEEPAGPQPTVRDVDAIAARLTSSNPDEVREAIDLLSVTDHPSVVPHLSTLLRSGRSDEVTDRALTALGGLGHPSAIDVLVEFTRHRRAGARRLAYRALAAIEDRRVPALLEQGLRDSDRNIR